MLEGRLQWAEDIRSDIFSLRRAWVREVILARRIFPTNWRQWKDKQNTLSSKIAFLYRSFSLFILQSSLSYRRWQFLWPQIL